MKKKRLIQLLVADGVLILLALVCFLCKSSMSAKLESQTAAERWAGSSETDYAQFSLFMSSTDQLTEETILKFRQTLNEKLTEAAMEAPAGGSLCRDGWSCTGSVKVFSEKSNTDASVIAVGGDFFFFHPLRLISGNYITESDLMQDRILLDRELAWKLFGGDDLEGLTVTISGKQYVIAGVIERETDKASTRAYTAGGGLFMSYSAYNEIAETPVSCYEIVMPQPVEGFAEEMLKSNFSLGNGELLNNTGRFSSSALWTIVRDFGTRSMHSTTVAYPYWENAARSVEDHCALLFFLGLLLAVLPVISALVTAIVLLIKGKDYLEDNVPEWTQTILEKRRKKRYILHGAHEKKRIRQDKAQASNLPAPTGTNPQEESENQTVLK